MNYLAIRDSCKKEVLDYLMPGQMMTVRPEFLYQVKENLKFDFQDNRFPPRKEMVSLYFSGLLGVAINFYYKSLRPKMLPSEREMYEFAAGFIAFPLLEVALKFLCYKHFCWNDEKGYVFLGRSQKLGDKKYKKGDYISNLWHVFELYKKYYKNADDLWDILISLDKEWIKRAGLNQQPSAKRRKVERKKQGRKMLGMFEELYTYRNYALHGALMNGGIVYLVILLLVIIYTDRNS